MVLRKALIAGKFLFMINSLCNRIFHKFVGGSPVKYLVDFRLRKVAEYLRTTSFSLSEIARKTGFNGTSYTSFSFFRQPVYGIRRFHRKTEFLRQVQ